MKLQWEGACRFRGLRLVGLVFAAFNGAWSLYGVKLQSLLPTSGATRTFLMLLICLVLPKIALSGPVLVTDDQSVMLNRGDELMINFDVKPFATFTSGLNPTSFLLDVITVPVSPLDDYGFRAELISSDGAVDLPVTSPVQAGSEQANGGPVEPISFSQPSWSFDTATSIALFGSDDQSEATILLQSTGHPITIQSAQYYLDAFPGEFLLANSAIVIAGLTADSCNCSAGGNVDSIELLKGTPVAEPSSLAMFLAGVGGFFAAMLVLPRIRGGAPRRVAFGTIKGLSFRSAGSLQ